MISIFYTLVVTKNCVCLNSMSVLKAVKHMWEGTNKSVMAADHSGSGGGGPNKEVEPVPAAGSMRNVDIKSTVSVSSTTCGLCGGEQEEFDLYSHEEEEIEQNRTMKVEAPATTSGTGRCVSCSANMPVVVSY